MGQVKCLNISYVYKILFLSFFTDSGENIAVGVGVGLGVGLPVGTFTVAAICKFWTWCKNRNRTTPRITPQSNVRTTVVETKDDRETDLHFTPPSGFSPTEPLLPATAECPSQPPTYSSAHNQQPSPNDALLSPGVSQPSYDATVPVIAMVGCL